MVVVDAALGKEGGDASWHAGVGVKCGGGERRDEGLTAVRSSDTPARTRRKTSFQFGESHTASTEPFLVASVGGAEGPSHHPRGSRRWAMRSSTARTTGTKERGHRTAC